jgi:hypothetical protein
LTTDDQGKKVVFIVTLDDEDELLTFIRQYEDLKMHMAEANESFEQGLYDMTQRKKYFTVFWLPLSMNFVQRWGADCVPPDLRRAINDTQRGLGASLTVWPEPDSL